MKNKIFNQKHFDYTNKIVQIFGFNSLADFTSELSYEHVKKNSNTICSQINYTFDNFKELFIVKDFDLARLDYKLDTAEQAYGFLKKLLEHLFIPYDTYRSKGTISLRLIPPNKFYINYIQKMSEIVQNSNENSELTQVETIVWSEAIKQYGTKPFEKEYVFGSKFTLNNLKDDFDCIDKITFGLYEETDKEKFLDIAGKHSIMIKIEGKINMKVDLKYQSIYDLFNLPIKLLFNHQVEIGILPAAGEEELCNNFPKNPVMFKIIVSGCKFKQSIPKYINHSKIYLDELTKDFGISKYYVSEGYVISEQKVVDKLNSYVKENTSNTDNIHPIDDHLMGPMVKHLRHMINVGKITEYQKYIYGKNIKITSLDNNEEDDIEFKKAGDNSTSYTPLYILVLLSAKLKKYGYSFVSRKILDENEQKEIFDCAVEYNQEIQMSMSYSEIKSDNTIEIVYELPTYFDAISTIVLPKKNYNYVCNFGPDEYQVIADSEKIIRFEQYKSRLNNNGSFKNIKVCVGKENLSDWVNTTFKTKSLYYNSQLRQLAIISKKNN
jgi:hypothetical protein